MKLGGALQPGTFHALTLTKSNAEALFIHETQPNLGREAPLIRVGLRLSQSEVAADAKRTGEPPNRSRQVEPGIWAAKLKPTGQRIKPRRAATKQKRTALPNQNGLATEAKEGGRYWVRTSDLFGVNEALYH